MKKHYTYLLQFILLTLFIGGAAFGQDITDDTPGSHTNTVPANAVSVTVQIWGAGGAGGGSTTINIGGAGGGGGGYSTHTFLVAPGQEISYIVGSGGTGTTGNGSNGENSIVRHTNSGTVMVANGGQGGGANNGTRGNGGTATGGTNTPGQRGFAGGSTGGNGGDAGNTTGTGGAGSNNINGSPGTIPGGGGGGGRSTLRLRLRSGGNGANGRVVITYTLALPPNITNFSPNPRCIGDEVTITGTNFTGATAVRFNGVAATAFTIDNDTQITATIPATDTGVISVTTPGGTDTTHFPLTIYTPSISPTSISASKTAVCAGEETTLTLVGGSAGSGAEAQWYSASCSAGEEGTGSSITVRPLVTTTYYVRYSGWCGTTGNDGNCPSVTITVDSPITDGVIIGDDTVCQGDNTVTYSVSGMLNATSYLWTVPDGATYTGQLTNTITVYYTNATSGTDTVTVTGSNSCGDHTVSLPVTVNAAPLINLTSGTNNQTLCTDTPLTNITYSIGGSATGAEITNGALPAGVTGSFNSGIFTISGTPTESGTFNYTVTTIGGLCGTVSTSGTITVEALPTLTLSSGAANQELCINTPITPIIYNLSGSPTGATVSGLPIGVTGSYNSGSRVFTISGTPTESGPFNYTVTTTGGTCAAVTQSGTITIDPLPTLVLSSASNTDNQIVCINTGLTAISYSIGGSATGATLTGTLPAGVTGSFNAGVFTINGTPTASGTFNYTVTTTGGLCTGVSVSGSIQVDALPTLALTSDSETDNQILCINTAIDDIIYAVGGSATNASVSGLPTGVTGNYDSGVFTISGTPTVSGTFNYTVTTSGGSCAPTSLNGTITVDPLPADAGTITGSTEVCQGATNVLYTVPAIANATGYVWTLPPGATIVSGENTYSIRVDYAFNASSGTVTVTGTNDCGSGVISAAFNVTVNITPYIPNNYEISTCSSEEVTFSPINSVNGNIVPTGTTYSWGLPSGTGFSGATALSGQTNFNQTLVNTTSAAQTAIYNVTATTAGCSASTFTLEVKVNPQPIAVATPATQTVCPNELTTITLSETRGISGTIDYSWTRIDGIGTLGSSVTSGNGPNISVSFTNTSNTAQTAEFEVIATSEYGCASELIIASVTVNPTPTVLATPSTLAICSEDTITPIALSNPNGVSGTTYSWTRDNTANITGIADGSGTSITGALTNTTNVPQTTIFTITASANSCGSSTTTVAITVNPKPTVEVNLPTQTVCGSSPIADIVISNPNTVSGVTYSWEQTANPNLSGIAPNGTGSTISGTLVNTTNTTQTATFTVRATSATCFSETTAEVIVNPTPIVIATPSTQTICDNTSANITLSTSNTPPLTLVSYTWSLIPNPNVIVSGANSGTGASITKTYQNTTTVPQVVEYNVMATSGNCTTTTIARVMVNPPLADPIISDNQAVCILANPARLNINNLTTLGGSGTYTYQWQQSTNGTTGWAAAPGTNNNSTYQPPTIPLFGATNYYYRVRIINSCGTVISNPVFIQVISNAGFDFSTTGIPTTAICPETSFTPVISSIHVSSSAVRYSWIADSEFIRPSTGGPVGTSGSSFLFLRTSTGNIGPLTAQNNTNATVTTTIEVTPAVYEYANNNPTSSDFICSVSPQYIDVTIRPNPVAFQTLANSTICSGASPGIEITGNITDASMQFNWSRDTPSGITGTQASGTSTAISPGGIFTIPGTLTNGSTVTREVTYTITPRSNGCSGTPITVKVNVAPNVAPGAVAANQTVCTNGDPVAFTQTTAATGLNLSYQWQISTTSATTGFTDIVGATSVTYDAPGPLTQNTWYRRIATSTVNGVSCSSEPSNVVQVSINTIDPGEISGEQTVCSGGDPTTLGNLTHATGAAGTRSYQWQMNTTGCDAESWTTIAGATGATYNPPAGLLVTTHYRRVVSYSNGSCEEVSNCVTVFVNDVTGGEIAGNQTICSNNPDAFTQVTASTGSGTLSYQWQSSTTSASGPWANITGTTLVTYDPPANVTTTTYYKRITISTLNGQACSTDSNILTVTPTDLTSGTISGNQTICSGDLPDPIIGSTITSTETFTYQWESRPNGTTSWTPIAGATGRDYTFTTSPTSNTDYRRIVISSSIACERTSGFMTVFVNTVTAPTIAGDQIVCSNQVPAAFTVPTPASGSGTLTYQWQSSTTSAGPWTNINLATGATYTPPILSETTYYQVVVTSRLNNVNCTAISNAVTVTVTPFTQATASGTTPTDCNATSTLTANGNGTWTAVPRTSGALYSFSSITDNNATFTGESGITYDITWTLDNPSPCDVSTATFTLVFPTCADNIDFNGTNNYTNFHDAFNFASDFGIELWVKRNNTATTKQTLFSKRDADNLSSGYDLSITNNRLTFNWNTSGNIQSSETLGSARWYHVAVTHNSGTYRLYIDGIETASAAGTSPSTNNLNALLGATGKAAGVPQDYYSGSVDELRIWNTGLTEVQIREMMNQEIEPNGTAVRGSVLGLDITGLAWVDLVGYYQMNQGTADIAAGQLADNSGTGTIGALMNMISNQLESAPLPYTTTANGSWTASSTWENGNMLQLPNTPGVDGTIVDWNIVQTNHDVNTNRATTILGLIISNHRLSVINDQELHVTKYLKIDGTLDLVGESQLLQPEGSIVDYAGTGTLERDQQGTGNMFNYNYWGSPVSTAGLTGARTYTLGGILYDGNHDQPVVWISGHNGNAGPPVNIARRWLYTYNGIANYYSEWNTITETSTIHSGHGFLMKGAYGVGTPQKNYTFKGQPNNGTITMNIAAGNSILIGNPYPSAIDANLFIKDNGPSIQNGSSSVLSDGALNFWEHFEANNTHVLRDYVGGYATYNLVGGVVAATPPSTIDGYEIMTDVPGTRRPQRYIPIAQGFFVNASGTGGDIVFKNSQRVFRTEASNQSIFFRAPEGSSDESQKRDADLESEDDIQRIRLTFKTPEGAIRPLLLGFTPDDTATDGIDYGYDAYNNDSFPSDLSFAIEGRKFVIQGVGAFDIDKKYPLDMTLKVTGNVELALTDLENFESPIDVYIHDALLDTYTKINTTSFKAHLEAGHYTDRFYLAFRPDDVLSNIDKEFKEIQVKYLQKTDEIYVKTPASIEVRQVYLINIAGQTVKSWNMTNMNFSQEFKIPVKDVSEGNYILKVETKTSSYNKKMIIKF